MPGPATLYLRDDSLPGTLAEFVATFSDEESCAVVLRRWKYRERGFECPRCGHDAAWSLPSRKLDECRRCGKQVLSCAVRRAAPYHWEIVGRENAHTPLPLAGAA